MNKLSKAEGKIFTEFDKDKVTRLSLLDKAILPFLKTHTTHEEGCQITYKMFNGKIYIA